MLKKSTNKNRVKKLSGKEDLFWNKIAEKRDKKQAHFVSHAQAWK